MRLHWTWWGGFLGPRLLSHVRCLACGAKYNGRTGKWNGTAVVLYNCGAFAIAILFSLGLLFGLMFLGGM